MLRRIASQLRVKSENIRCLTQSSQSEQTFYSNSEARKFAWLATEWWKTNSYFKPLHSMNYLRIPFVRDGLLESYPQPIHRYPLNNLKILDVGCGGGLLSEPLARLGATVIGIDAAPESVEAARAHAENDPPLLERLTYRCSTVDDLVADYRESFDGIVASEVIEHIDNKRLFVEQCSRLLKPGGCLFITTLNRTARAWALAIVGAEYLTGIVPRGTHDWDMFVTPNELRDYIMGCNMRQTLVHGMIYVPVIDRWCWSKDTSVNYAMRAVKLAKQQAEANPQEESAKPGETPKV